MTEELDILTAQLGRRPRGSVQVIVSCPAGHPAVIRCHPWQQRRHHIVPMPTLYWLTCPRLAHRLADLERQGEIIRIERHLRFDADLLDRLRDDHERYRAQRSALLNADQCRMLADLNLLNPLQSRGIAGLTRFDTVKCLHAHYAQHLVDRNVIGELLELRHGISPCWRRGGCPGAGGRIAASA